MPEGNASEFPLPIVSRDTFNSLISDVNSRGFAAVADTAEDTLQLENFELYQIMGLIAATAGWTEEQVTAARKSMSLTHELLRRKAEADLQTGSGD